MLSLQPAAQAAVWLSLGVAWRAVLGALPVAVGVALLLQRLRLPGRVVLTSLANLPLMVPPVVTGWLLLLVFGVQGPIGAWLYAWFGVRLAFTENGAALACGVMVFPIMLRSIRLSVAAIDPDLLAAARTLGAGGWDRFCSIVLPLAGPGLLGAAVLGFTASLGEFGAVITFAANIPGQTQTIPLAIFSALESPGGEDVAARLALVSIGLAMLGLLVAELLNPRRGRG